MPSSKLARGSREGDGTPETSPAQPALRSAPPAAAGRGGFCCQKSAAAFVACISPAATSSVLGGQAPSRVLDKGYCPQGAQGTGNPLLQKRMWASAVGAELGVGAPSRKVILKPCPRPCPKAGSRGQQGRGCHCSGRTVPPGVLQALLHRAAAGGYASHPKPSPPRADCDENTTQCQHPAPVLSTSSSCPGGIPAACSTPAVPGEQGPGSGDTRRLRTCTQKGQKRSRGGTASASPPSARFAPRMAGEHPCVPRLPQKHLSNQGIKTRTLPEVQNQLFPPANLTAWCYRGTPCGKSSEQGSESRKPWW